MTEDKKDETEIVINAESDYESIMKDKEQIIRQQYQIKNLNNDLKELQEKYDLLTVE